MNNFGRLIFEMYDISSPMHFRGDFDYVDSVTYIKFGCFYDINILIKLKLIVKW
jgi:hypothetical protein